MKTLIDKRNSKDLKRYDVSDDAIRRAMREVAAGKIDANLGGGLIKQRIGREGHGKSGGCRSILVSHCDELLILVHLFPKGEKDNITAREKRTLIDVAAMLRKQSRADLERVAELEEWRTIEDDPRG